MPNTALAVRPDLQEATSRNRTACHIVTGFSRATPNLAELWQQISQSLSDVPILALEITRLDTELRIVRLDRANLAAAGRATLAAYRSGESDPIAYLRDELDAQGFTAGQRGRP